MQGLTKQELDEINAFVETSEFNNFRADVFKGIDSAMVAAKRITKYNIKLASGLMRALEIAMKGSYELMKAADEAMLPQEPQDSQIPQEPQEPNNPEGNDGRTE